MPSSQCLLKIIQRYINDVQNWAVNIKTLVIFHRCLQDKDLSQPIAKELKPKAHILQPFTRKTDSEGDYSKPANPRDARIISILSRQYIEYLTGLINFITKTSLLSKKVMEAPRYVQKLRTNDIFLVYEQFDKFITFIMNMFEN